MTTSTTLEPTTTNEGFPERFIQVCPSDNFTLFLQASGDAWACGENSRGQLGNQSIESISTPFIFGRGFVKLDVGQLHAGGIDVNKRLFLWGDGWHGEQGIDPNSISENADERFISLPTRRASSVIDFALGNARTFLITSEGSIFACGENTNGILGTASTEIHVREFEIVTTPEGLKFEKIDAGIDHFGAIDENGALWMWGSNEFNKLALPGESTTRGATKVIPANVRSVSCGESFTIATLINGRVLAVGKGGWGEVSSWFDVVGEPSRDYALTELWGSADHNLGQRMKIIYADFSEIILFIDDFYAFKFVPDLTFGFKTTKLGKIYSRYTAPFTSTPEGLKNYTRSDYQYMDVTFQETGFELYEPLDFTLDGWGSQNGDAVVLSYQVEQLTTTTDDPNQTSTTLEPTTSTSTTLEPTTSTSTTSSTTTSTSSTTIDPATLDSDSDGVNDAEDYFFEDPRISETEAELQTWVSDPDRTLEENSDEAIVIRALRTYDNTLELGKFYLFYRDDYGVIEMTDQDGTSDGSLSADLSARGEGWEVIKPFIATTTSTTTSSTTEEPTTSSSTTEEQNLEVLNSAFAWFDADKSSSIIADEFGDVETWKDKTLNSFDVDSESNRRPLNGGSIGGKNALLFNSSSKLDRDLITIQDHQSVYIVAKWEGSNFGYNGLFTGYNFDSSQSEESIGIIVDGSDSLWVSSWFDEFFLNGSQITSSDSIKGTMESPFIISGSSVDDVTIDGGITIGSDRGYNGRGWVGMIGEVIVFDYKLSNSNHQIVEGYLAHKWGISGNLPGSHTYKTEPPQITTSTTEEPTTSSTTEEPDPLISSSSGVELYEGARFLLDGYEPWIVTSKIDENNYVMKSQGQKYTIISYELTDTYEVTLAFTGVNCAITSPHPQSPQNNTSTGHWWVHDGETDNHPNRTTNHDDLNNIDLRLQKKNYSDGRRGDYYQYVSPNDDDLNALYDANILNPIS